MERGIKQGIAQVCARRAEALERFGVEVDGVRMLPDTPEVQSLPDSEKD